MSEDPIPAVDTAIPAISQVAFVVEDLEAGMRRFGSLLGIEPWLLYRYEPPRLTETTYRGERSDYSMRVALSDVRGPVDLSTKLVSGGSLKRFIGWLTSLRDYLGLGSSSADALPNPGVPGVNVELIEPLSGPSIYTSHLEEDGPGIHHIGCFTYDDPRAVVEQYREAGIEVVQSGCFEGLEFWYLDMREELDGLVLELAANLGAIEEPDEVFPP